jgi:hypothetical protein
MIGNHQPGTRAKIGSSVLQSSWRRRTAEKSKAEMQSAVGQWDEDFSTPSSRHIRSRGLWEECHNSMDYNR